MKHLLDEISSGLRQWDGPLTRELVQTPGAFGLGRVPERIAPTATTTMVCGFCSTGCGLKVHLADGQAVNLSPETSYPVNLGMACPKGWEALTPLSAKDRVTTPLMRDADGVLKPASWHTAMTEFCAKLKDIQRRHGPDSVAVLSTGQIVTEEMAFLGALAKLGMGIVHLDSNTRQCMATSHVAYKQSFGFDAPPFTYTDFEESDVLVFVGSNLCIAHPIMWQRVLRNKHTPEIIVVDPRKTETAMAATQHYGIQPKSDLVLLYGLANILISSGWIDRGYIEANTSGYTEFAEFMTQFTTDRVCAETGLTADELWHFAQTIHAGKRVSFWWTMGVNQGHESTRTAQALINLALITGNMGRPGTGANSVTGQCNAMGSRLFAHATGLPCGRDFLKADDREDIARLYNMPVECVPQVNSMAYDQIVDGVRDGKIKALWVLATNTAHSWIDSEDFNRATANLEFLVVQDMYATTDTADRADMILPAAGWGEKDGTLINSERRIGLVKKVRRAPGEALSDFSILRLIAEYWGVGQQFAEWSSPEAVFRIMQRLSKGKPCDISGIDGYREIEDNGGLQWPVPSAESSRDSQRRLFEDGHYFTPSGKANILFEQPRPVAEPTSAEFPFVMLTGRGTSAQWHTNTRTGKSDVLRTLYPADCYVEIHPEDAMELNIANGSTVTVQSRRGSIRAKAVLTPIVQRGQIFAPMHYREVNKLTKLSFDPYSRQPSYKHCAVRVRTA